MADVELTQIAAYIAAGACMGIGTLGPALGLGFIGGKACESIGKNPESSNAIMRAMILALALTEALGVYALLISLLLIYR
jgi:F-type H+-transporting ATPase subunit c